MKQFLEKFGISDTEPVIIACSGGADSMYLLSELLDYHNACIVGHFDHALRSTESDADRTFVQSYCQEKNIPCFVGTADIRSMATQDKIGIEEAARNARYAFLRWIKEQCGARYIFTGHHLDDKIETMIFNLIRGTKFSGISSLKECNQDILRPLLRVSKTEILDMCTQREIPYRTDSSNEDTSFLRNKIRQDILPQFTYINSGYQKSLENFMEYTEEVLRFIDEEVNTFLSGSECFEVTAFFELTPFLQKEVIRFLYLRKNQGTMGLSVGNIQEIIRFIGNKGNYTKKEVQNLKLEKINGKIFVKE